MTAPACRHPDDPAVWSLTEIRQAFGPSVVARVPEYPEYIQLLNDTRSPVFLSRMTCKLHFAQISPDTVAATRARLVSVPTAAEKAAVKASVRLDKLLADARAGKTVAPVDVANAQAAVQLEELAAQGAKERAEAAAAQAAAEARTALEKPAIQKLTASRARVQQQLDAAFTALMDLLDAVDADMAVHDEVLAVLLAGGFDPAGLRTASGYAQQTVVGGEAFPFHLKAEYLLPLLHTLKTTRHMNSFVGVGGRSISKELPVLTAGGPRISPDRVT